MRTILKSMSLLLVMSIGAMLVVCGQAMDLFPSPISVDPGAQYHIHWMFSYPGGAYLLVLAFYVLMAVILWTTANQLKETRG